VVTVGEKAVIEVKEESTGKTRLFRKREDVVVITPKEVQEKYDGVPTSIVVRAMSHSEAEVRKRLKQALITAQSVANQKAGISETDILNYTRDLIQLESIDSKKNQEEYEKESLRFIKKHSKLKEKLNAKDLTGVYSAEDAIRANAVQVVANNCVKLVFDDIEEEVNAETIDCIHPDLFYWILKHIEEESYLTEGEVLGFQ